MRRSALLFAPIVFAVACAGAASAPSPHSAHPVSSDSAKPEHSDPPAASSSAPAPAVSSAPTAKTVTRSPATLKGTIAGKPFEAASACVMTGAEPGHMYLEIYDNHGDAQKSCMVLSSQTGARKIGVVLPWKEGQKVDLATLKPKSKNEPAFFVMERINEKKVERKDSGKDFTVTGSVEIVRTAEKDGVARIRLVSTMGKDKLEGEVDVEVK